MDILGKLKSVNGGKKTETEEHVTAATFSPRPPRVDLLPDRVRLEARTRRARRISYAGAAAAAVAVASLWGAGFIDSQAADRELVEAQALAEDASVQLAKFAPVTNLAKQTKSLLATVETQEADAVDHQEVLDRFLAASTGTLANPTITISTNGPGSCISSDPFNQVPLAGCLTFSGEGDHQTLLRSLGEEPWFSDAFIPSVGTAGDGVQTIAGSVGINMSALPVTESTDTPEEGQ